MEAVEDHTHVVGHGVDKAGRISQTYWGNKFYFSSCVSGVHAAPHCTVGNADETCATAANCGEHIYDPPASSGGGGAHAHTMASHEHTFQPKYVGLLKLARVL